MRERIAPLQSADVRRRDTTAELQAMGPAQLESLIAEYEALPSSSIRDRCLERTRASLKERSENDGQS